MAVPLRWEVGENSLEIGDSFRYFGDMISCGGGIESSVSDRISCARSKMEGIGELASTVT